MTSRERVRRGLLLDALGDPVDLNVVDWHVRRQNPSANTVGIQQETLEVIRSLVTDGLCLLGGEEVIGDHPSGVASQGERFVAWREDLNKALHKISKVYIKHYDDPERWMYAAALLLTDKGRELAQSMEHNDIESYRSRQ
jgi:hypothetical protein